MKDLELKDIDVEDLEDLLSKMQDSFDIKFVDNELAHVQTFGELCDHIKSKIQLEKSKDCTTQQAFYKLRSAIATISNVDKDELTTDTLLKNLLPRKTRRKKTKKIEDELGFKLALIRPTHFVTGFLALLLLASFIGLFIRWQIGLTGLALSMAGLWLAEKTGNELDLRTIGQLAEKMTRENYLKSRRNPKTFNENEIEKVLTDWFSRGLNINKSKLSREARLT
jgi:acyl carrier protein